MPSLDDAVVGLDRRADMFARGVAGEKAREVAARSPRTTAERSIMVNVDLGTIG